MTGYQLAIAAAGSQRKLARLLGLSSQAVCQWRGQVPINRVAAVEAATGVSREDLRPDFFRRPEKSQTGPALDSLPPSH